MTPNELAGKNISLYRQAHELSLANLATNSCLPESRLHAIEEGKATVTVQEFCRIAEAMNCDPCDLLVSDQNFFRCN